MRSSTTLESTNPVTYMLSEARDMWSKVDIRDVERCYQRPGCVRAKRHKLCVRTLSQTVASDWIGTEHLFRLFILNPEVPRKGAID